MGKRKKYNRKRSAEIKRMKSGMSHECSDCGCKEQIPVNKAYSAFRARCSACGGPLQRIWIKGAGATKSGTCSTQE